MDDSEIAELLINDESFVGSKVQIPGTKEREIKTQIQELKAEIERRKVYNNTLQSQAGEDHKKERDAHLLEIQEFYKRKYICSMTEKIHLLNDRETNRLS